MKMPGYWLLLAFGLLTASQTPAVAAITSAASSNSPETGVATASQSTPLSIGLDDVVKLSKSGVNESVVLAFVENSPVAYHPSADDILKLRDAGVSSKVISAIIQRGGELRRQLMQAAIARARQAAAEVPPPVQQPAATTYAVPTYAAPASSALYLNDYPLSYPYYNYWWYNYNWSYPAFYYPYTYYPSVYFRDGFHNRYPRGGRFQTVPFRRAPVSGGRVFRETPIHGFTGSRPMGPHPIGGRIGGTHFGGTRVGGFARGGGMGHRR